MTRKPNATPPTRRPPATVADALDALERRRRKATPRKPKTGLDLDFIP